MKAVLPQSSPFSEHAYLTNPQDATWLPQVTAEWEILLFARLTEPVVISAFQGILNNSYFEENNSVYNNAYFCLWRLMINGPYPRILS